MRFICIFSEAVTKLNASYYFYLKKTDVVPSRSSNKKQELKVFHRFVQVLLNPNPHYAQLRYLGSKDWLCRRHVIMRLLTLIFF